jgi:choloylglycine hydrolase
VKYITLLCFVYLVVLSTSKFSPIKFLNLGEDEKELHKKTMNSLKKITDNFYLVDYQNDYYFKDIIKANIDNFIGIIAFAIQKFGPEYDFNITLKENKIGCSSFNSFNKNKENQFCRNFDYPQNKHIAFWTHPKDGYASINFASGIFLGYSIFHSMEELVRDRLLLLPYTVLDGMNEKGLSISVLWVKEKKTHQVDPSKNNLITTLFIRGVLDTCKNVDEAVEFFQKYNMHEPFIQEGDKGDYHFMVTDQEGKSVVIEYSENKIYLTYPKNKVSYVTNYIISEAINTTHRGSPGDDRFKKIEEKLNSTNGILEWKESMKLLESVSQKSNETNKTVTEWSNVYNTKQLNVIISSKNNFEKLYEVFLSKPLEIKDKPWNEGSSKGEYLKIRNLLSLCLLMIIL